VNRRALFPGKNTIHMLELMCRAIGSPTDADLAAIGAPPQAVKVIRQLGHIPAPPLQEIVPGLTNPLGLDFLSMILQWDPNKRASAEQLLSHPYLAALHDPADEPIAPEPFHFVDSHVELSDRALRVAFLREAARFHPEEVRKLVGEHTEMLNAVFSEDGRSTGLNPPHAGSPHGPPSSHSSRIPPSATRTTPMSAVPTDHPSSSGSRAAAASAGGNTEDSGTAQTASSRPLGPRAQVQAALLAGAIRSLSQPDNAKLSSLEIDASTVGRTLIDPLNASNGADVEDGGGGINQPMSAAASDSVRSSVASAREGSVGGDSARGSDSRESSSLRAKDPANRHTAGSTAAASSSAVEAAHDIPHGSSAVSGVRRSARVRGEGSEAESEDTDSHQGPAKRKRNGGS